MLRYPTLQIRGDKYRTGAVATWSAAPTQNEMKKDPWTKTPAEGRNVTGRYGFLFRICVAPTFVIKPNKEPS